MSKLFSLTGVKFRRRKAGILVRPYSLRTSYHCKWQMCRVRILKLYLSIMKNIRTFSFPPGVTTRGPKQRRSFLLPRENKSWIWSETQAIVWLSPEKSLHGFIVDTCTHRFLNAATCQRARFPPDDSLSYWLIHSAVNKRLRNASPHPYPSLLLSSPPQPAMEGAIT